MNKLWFLTMLIFADSSLFAQQQKTERYNIEINYNLTYYPDSTNDKKVVREQMELLVNSKESIFRSKKKGILDSAAYDALLTGNKTPDPLLSANQTAIKYLILKEGIGIKTYDEYMLTPNKFYYSDLKSDQSWKILSDTTTIGGMLCQKAELHYGNRDWTAWFTMEIPISDGPYKFCGLPGLIMSIYDNKKYWYFEITNVKNIIKETTINFDRNWIPQAVTKAEFFKQKRNYIDNTLQIEEASGRFSFPDAKSRKLSIQNFKERARRNNNWIELYKP